MKLIFENWRHFLKEEETRTGNIDPNASPEDIAKQLGLSIEQAEELLADLESLEDAEKAPGVHHTGGHTGVEYDEAGNPMGYTGYDTEVVPEPEVEHPWGSEVPLRWQITDLMQDNPGMTQEEARAKILAKKRISS